MGGISARVSKAAQASAMITPFWKTYNLHIELQMDQTAPARAFKTGKEIQLNITEPLRSVFITLNVHETLAGTRDPVFHSLTMLLFPLKSDAQTK